MNNNSFNTILYSFFRKTIKNSNLIKQKEDTQNLFLRKLTEQFKDLYIIVYLLFIRNYKKNHQWVFEMTQKKENLNQLYLSFQTKQITSHVSQWSSRAFSCKHNLKLSRSRDVVT